MKSTVLIATMMFLSAPTLAQDATVKNAIQKQYDKEAAALARKDIPGIFSINTSDYSVTGLDGVTVKRAALLTKVTQVMAVTQTSQVRTKIEKVTQKGDTVSVITTDSSIMVLLDPGTKTKMTIEGTSRNEDTWVKQKGVWLRKKNRVLADKTLVNGKPVGG